MNMASEYESETPDVNTEFDAPEPSGSETSQAKKPARKSTRALLVSGAVVVLAGASVGVAALMGAFATPEPQAVAEPPAVTAPAPKPTTPPPPRQPITVEIGAVEQMPYSEVWIPPDEGQYFWQVVDSANGYPETGGTTYVLAHACETRHCAGDEVRKLEVGDTVNYLGQAYTVQESREILKTTIAEQDVWYHDPNRLIVITCIIEGDTGELSKMNDIVIAVKA